MRKFVVASLSIAVLYAGAAEAADLPVRKATAPIYSSASVYNWTGFYAGLNAGYGSAPAKLSVVTDGVSETLSGVLGGVQIGYNWQNGNFVLGLEGDFQASGQSKSVTATSGGLTASQSDKIPYFGTLRGRLGYAFDRWMPYITGGWGYNKFTSNVKAITPITASGNSSTWHSAWVLGGGVEAALTGNWTWKVEYLYIDSGTITNSYAIAGRTLVNSGSLKDNVVRVGLNYRF